MATDVTAITPQELLDQEDRLALPSLSEADAIAIGQLLLDRANERSLPVTIEVRRGPRVVFRAARVGTSVDNDSWVAGKVRLVERFGHSSLYERVLHEANGTTFEAATGLTLPDYAPHGGGFPLIVKGTGPVGVAIVSGLTQEDDHALIIECLEAYLAGRRG